jgi:TonB family protein
LELNKSIIGLFLLTHKICFSQRDEIVRYYDKNGSETDSDNCYYSWHYLYFAGEKDTIKTYYCKTGRLRSLEALFKKVSEGVTIYYYPNGQLKEKILYKDGTPTGSVTQFFPNGKIRVEKIYVEPLLKKTNMPFNYMIMNAWDSLGKQTVKNFNGKVTFETEEPFLGGYFVETGKIQNGYRDSVWSVYDQSGQTLITEKFNKGEFIEGYRIVGSKNVHYTEYQVSASPKQGLQKLYEGIGKNLVYPRSARKAGIEGKVFVKFVIERDGRISNVAIAKGVESSLNNEAMRVVLEFDPWNPGYHRGAPVRQAFTLPLAFKFK